MSNVRSDLRSVVTADGAVILDISANEMTTLNPTGGYVWRRLHEGKTVEQIVADLARETGQDPVAIASDVQEFVEQLEGKHLVNR